MKRVVPVYAGLLDSVRADHLPRTELGTTFVTSPFVPKIAEP